MTFEDRGVGDDEQTGYSVKAWTRTEVEAAGEDILAALQRPIVESLNRPFLEALKGPLFDVSEGHHDPQNIDQLAARTGLDRSLLVLAGKRLEIEGRVKAQARSGEKWYWLVE
jgi:hypothetical protein